jgi:hypothetical protein
MPELTPINRSFPRHPCYPNLSRYCPSQSLLSCRQAKAPHTDSMLGGGAPTWTTAGLSWTVFTVVGKQNGDPLLPRSRRWKPCHVWCLVDRVRSRPHCWPWCLHSAMFCQCCWMKGDDAEPLDLEPTAKIRCQNAPSF